MNWICKFVMSLVVLSSTTSLVAAADFSLPKYQKATLKNGLTVYLMEQKEVPLIDVTIVVKAGAVQDSKAGLAAMTADTLLLGTQEMDKQTFEQKLDFIGAQISSSASLESSRLSVSMAKSDASTVLPMAFDAFTQPAFSQQEFDKYKTRYLSGLAQRQESPRAMLKTYFDAVLYKGHPYANDQDGSPATVKGITLDDIKTFHKMWYKPDNAAVVIAGDFDSKSMLKRIEAIFSTWKGKSEKSQVANDIPAPEKAQILLVDKSDAKESTFIIGGPGIPFNNPDSVAVSVINTILGARFTSWLNDELRVNSGLTYGARSRFDTKRYGGGFYISSFTKTETTTEAIDLAIKTYQRLWKKGVDKTTLESAKAYVKGQFPPDFETSSQLADLMSNMFVYGFNEQYINTFNDQVNKLDEEKAKQIVSKYFPKEALQFVVIGEAEAIREKVKKYGSMLETNIKQELTL